MESSTKFLFRPRLRLRKVMGALFYVMFLLALLIGILGLGALLVRVLVQGLPWLDLAFLTNYPSRFPEQAGIRAALFGTIWMAGMTAIFTVPVGVGAALYLEEYAPKNWFTSVVEVNIANLAGVPSIVYGLLGLAVFVTFFGLGRSVLAGALTMSLLVMPVVILASREAIRAVPRTYADAAYALGATCLYLGPLLPAVRGLRGRALRVLHDARRARGGDLDDPVRSPRRVQLVP